MAAKQVRPSPPPRPQDPRGAIPAVRLASSADLPAIEDHMRRMIAEDIGGYDPLLHGDVDDLRGYYLETPERALLVCAEEVAGGATVVWGTATVSPGGPSAKYVPRWLSERYAHAPTGQVGRVWVARRSRRRGVGRALALAGVRWATEFGYSPVCLHTNASIPGALAFWRAFPGAVEVFDARPADPWSTVHFEVDPRVALGAPTTSTAPSTE